jgi:hypothetical protein
MIPSSEHASTLNHVANSPFTQYFTHNCHRSQSKARSQLFIVCWKMPLSEKKKSWGKEHNTALKQLFESEECNPQHLVSQYIDLVYANVDDNHVFQSICPGKVPCWHYKDKASQWMTNMAMSSVQHSEFFFLSFSPVSSSNQTHIFLFLHIS